MKYLPSCLLLFMALFISSSLQAQITYPDKATYDFSQNSTLINFDVYSAAYPDYAYGPDASIYMTQENDSLVLRFGHPTNSVIAIAKQWSDFSNPASVDFKVYKDNRGHYLGSKDPNPGNYDYELWPHKNVFEGNDGHLYSIAYLEFTGWTVYGWNTPQCPSNNVNFVAFECWMSAAILVKSTDGGLTWDKAGDDPSEYVVASSPYKYREQNNTERHGAFPFGGGDDANYGLMKIGEYFYIGVEFWGEGFKIQSYARTNDITDASSWRFFDGTDFTIPNVNPYAQEVSDPASHLPPPIDNYYPLDFNSNLDPVEGLTYSSYFNKYIKLRFRSFDFAPEITPGVYYYLSEDGFNWSGNALVLPFEGNFTNYDYPGDDESRWAISYISLIDQNNPGGDIGQNAYLAYVSPYLVNGEEAGSTNNKRDIKYVPFSFATHQVSSFEVGHTGLEIPEDANPGDGYCDNGYGKCSVITAVTETESRPYWVDSSVPLTITIGQSAPDTLLEDYVSRITKRTLIDGSSHAGYSANSSEVAKGWNGTYGVHITPGFNFMSGSGHVLKGIDVASVLLGGGEDGSETTSVDITGSKIGYLELYNAHTDGVLVGGSTADSANIIEQVVFKGSGNIIKGNHIGHDGTENLISSDESIIDMNAGNTLDGNVIAGNANILMNFGSSDASGNSVINNHFGYLPWSNSSMGSSSAGIKLVEAENNEFSGNVIKFSNTNDQEAAIFVLNANDNKFYSNTISNNTGHGIHFSGTSTGNQFGAINSGNIVKDNSGWGVNFLVNTATGNPVSSNQIYNNTLGSIGNYTNITPINTPTLLAAYSNSSSDSIIIRHTDISENTSANYLVDVFSNDSEPTLPQGKTLLASEITLDSSALSLGRIAFPYTGNASGYVSSTFTDDRQVTSEFSNTVPLLPSSQSPVAQFNLNSISRDHTGDWFSEVTLTVTNTGASNLNISLEESLEWLIIEPNYAIISNGDSASFVLTLDSRELSPEILSHTGFIQIASNELTPTLNRIPVEITFTSSEDEWLRLSESSFDLSYKIPNQDSTISQTLQLTNDGTDAVNWRMTKNQGWIMGLSPNNGTIQPGNTSDVTISYVLKANDPEGTKSAMLVLFAGTVPENETVTEIPFEVTMLAKNAASVIVETEAINLQVPQPSSNTQVSSSIKVINTGNAGLNWSLSKNQPWITFPQTNGTMGQETKDLAVAFQINSTDPIGPKQGTITLTTGYTGGAQQTFEIPVSVQITASAPEISLNMDSLLVSFQKPTENTTATASFTIYSQHSDSVNWMVIKNQPWIAGFEPAGGKLKDSVEVAVSFNLRSNDPLGFKNADITVVGFFDGSEDQTQVILPVRLTLTEGEQGEQPKVSFNPSTIALIDSVELGDSWETTIELDIANEGNPGLNFQFLQTGTSFVTSNPFNGQIEQITKVQLAFSFADIQEAISMDTTITYRMFYPQQEVVDVSIPLSLDIAVIKEEVEPLPQIMVTLNPDSLVLNEQISLGDTLFIDEKLSIKNSGDIGLNWELTLPQTPSSAPKLTGVINDSLILPIQLEVSDIIESAQFTEELSLLLWYDVERNGENIRVDSLFRIPLIVQVDVLSVNTESYGDQPSEIVLYQNYPNPFNPSTQISFALPASEHVELSIYNVSGQKVAELLNQQMSAGVHQITFDAQSLSSGTYIYQLKTSDGVLSKKLMLIK